MLNRSAIIVRPKQPYLDWALALDDTCVREDALVQKPSGTSFDQKDRARRLMREIGLQARLGRRRERRVHDGTITTEKPQRE